MIKRTLLLVSLLLLAAGCAHVAEDEFGSIAGSVVLEAQVSYAGANVSVEGTALHAVTSAAGDYLLTNVPVGSYVLAASKTGYETATREITVTAGSSSTGIGFSLILQGPPAPPF